MMAPFVPGMPATNDPAAMRMLTPMSLGHPAAAPHLRHPGELPPPHLWSAFGPGGPGGPGGPAARLSFLSTPFGRPFPSVAAPGTGSGSGSGSGSGWACLPPPPLQPKTQPKKKPTTAILPTGRPLCPPRGPVVCDQPNCTKTYTGPNAVSNIKRHKANVHQIPLSQQPRLTRWDRYPNRPKTEQDRRERMLEAKRKYARKARARQKAASTQHPQHSSSSSLLLVPTSPTPPQASQASFLPLVPNAAPAQTTRPAFRFVGPSMHNNNSKNNHSVPAAPVFFCTPPPPSGTSPMMVAPPVRSWSVPNPTVALPPVSPLAATPSWFDDHRPPDGQSQDPVPPLLPPPPSGVQQLNPLGLQQQIKSDSRSDNYRHLPYHHHHHHHQHHPTAQAPARPPNAHQHWFHPLTDSTHFLPPAAAQSINNGLYPPNWTCTSNASAHSSPLSSSSGASPPVLAPDQNPEEGDQQPWFAFPLSPLLRTSTEQSSSRPLSDPCTYSTASYPDPPSLLSLSSMAPPQASSASDLSGPSGQELDHVVAYAASLAPAATTATVTNGPGQEQEQVTSQGWGLYSEMVSADEDDTSSSQWDHSASSLITLPDESHATSCTEAPIVTPIRPTTPESKLQQSGSQSRSQYRTEDKLFTLASVDKPEPSDLNLLWDSPTALPTTDPKCWGVQQPEQQSDEEQIPARWTCSSAPVVPTLLTGLQGLGLGLDLDGTGAGNADCSSTTT